MRSPRWERDSPPRAAKLLNPRRRVMAVCDDGGFMMNSQELETAVRLKLDLVVLIIEDFANGMIRWKQAVDFLILA
jgi:acetolactate synthase I/II/III large subunit